MNDGGTHSISITTVVGKNPAERIWRANEGSTDSQETVGSESEAELQTQTTYTNEDHDPNSSQPWNNRQHFRFRGEEEMEEDISSIENCMSPLPVQIPLSPPVR